MLHIILFIIRTLIQTKNDVKARESSVPSRAGCITSSVSGIVV